MKEDILALKVKELEDRILKLEESEDRLTKRLFEPPVYDAPIWRGGYPSYSEGYRPNDV